MTLKRILIAGGAGYIGSHAAKAVRQAGLEPIVLDDLTRDMNMPCAGGRWSRADIRNADAVRAAIRQYKPDAVMQFAARIEVGRGREGPRAFLRQQCRRHAEPGPHVMLEEGVKNLVFSSTCAIYGDPERCR
jgi:UDP-glucose 4-epimerase